MLEFRNVDKTYRSRQSAVVALQAVSFHLEAGAMVALQGPSGCGKTTLLLTAGGLLAPDRGEVLTAGESLYALPLERRARVRASHLGFVFQQFHLIPYLNVLENVQVPALALGTPQSEALGRAEELVTNFGLFARRHHLPEELSTGERQRTALARAMMNRPTLLLADEPTGNLDSENAARVLEALEDFARDGGAVLLASHDDRTAARGCRLWRMAAGQIREVDERTRG